MKKVPWFAPTQIWEPPAVDGRAPPHDLGAEAATLGAILTDAESTRSKNSFDRVQDFLRPKHFYSERHRQIYQAVWDLSGERKPFDVVSVASLLGDHDRLEQCGGFGYLTEILGHAPSLENADHYGRIVFTKYRIRQLILSCQRAAATGYGDYGEPQAFIDMVEHEVFQLAHVDAKRSMVSFSVAMRERVDEIAQAAREKRRTTGVESGFRRYDDMTAGMHDGDLTIVAARPGMGKTSLVLNIATNVVRSVPWTETSGLGAVVFSLEMPTDQVVDRILCSESRVDVSRIRKGKLEQSDWASLGPSASALDGVPMWIDDNPSVTVMDIRAAVRRLQAEHDRRDENGRVLRRVALVVVDYLQLMKGREGASSREQEISEISRGLKGLAKELRVPVIALSQLNRAVETRGEKSRRPLISDLRESGAIEQDADNICFIYRDDYYNREDSEEPNIAELILAKQRNGPTGTVKVRFDRKYTRFDNLAEGEYEGAENEGDGR